MRSYDIEMTSKLAVKFRKEMMNKKIPYDDVISFTCDEFINFLEKDVVPKNLKQRDKCFGILYTNGKARVINKDELSKEL